MAKKYTNDKQRISISEELSLRNIKKEDSSILYALMQRIYPPAYLDYWKDGGKWYVNDLYNVDNIQKELSEENTDYFFVLLEGNIIGIMRLVYGLDINYEKDIDYVKLHRLYLDQNIQNKGIGYQIMTWLIHFSKEKGYPKLWLEVMEKQHQAVHFYRKLNFTTVDKVTVE